MPTPARVVLAWGVVLLVLTLVNARLAEAITPAQRRSENIKIKQRDTTSMQSALSRRGCLG